MNSHPQARIEEMLELLRAETHMELFKAMTDRDSNWSECGFRVFYDRFGDNFRRICNRVAREQKGDAWAQDVFNDTFRTAYEKAGSFKVPDGCPEDQVYLRVLGWLGRIASNQINDILAERPERTKTPLFWEKIAQEPAIEDAADKLPEKKVSKKQRLINEAIETLSEKQATVLRVTMQYHRVGKKHQRLPNDVCDDLAKNLGISPEYVRKLRQRAQEKVEEYVRQNL